MLTFVPKSAGARQVDSDLTDWSIATGTLLAANRNERVNVSAKIGTHRPLNTRRRLGLTQVAAHGFVLSGAAV